MSTYPYASFVSTTPFPISTGEVLDKLWRTLRCNWKLYLCLGAPPAALGIAWMVVIFAGLFAAGVIPPHPGMQPDPMRVMIWVSGATAIGIIPNLVIFALYQAAAAFAGLKAAGNGQTTVREAYAVAWRRAGRYCWLMILQYLCAAAPMLIIAGLVIAGMAVLQSGGHPNPAVMFVVFPVVFLVYLGAMAYAIWMALNLGLAFSASVAEDLPAVAALKRSARLSHKVKGKLFLVMLVVYALSYAAVFVVEFLVGGVAALSVVLFQLMHLSTAVGIVLGAIAGLAFLALIFVYMALVWAAYLLGFTIVYCDQRLRLDGAIGGFSQAQPEAPLA
jgi:hypothetical protein